MIVMGTTGKTSEAVDGWPHGAVMWLSSGRAVGTGRREGPSGGQRATLGGFRTLPPFQEHDRDGFASWNADSPVGIGVP